MRMIIDSIRRKLVRCITRMMAITAPRTIRRESPILPRSDPFAIGGASMLDTWGPVLRSCCWSRYLRPPE